MQQDSMTAHLSSVSGLSGRYRNGHKLNEESTVLQEFFVSEVRTREAAVGKFMTLKASDF